MHLCRCFVSCASVGWLAAGGEQKKVRQRRRRKPKPAAEAGDDQLAKKRRLSDEQARFLEMSFRKERKLETPRKVRLAAEVGLDAKQVAVWFQNRRARHKSKLMEEEFAKLRAAHDAAVLQSFHLETEVTTSHMA
jgi:homeobox-leucine zipper protein